MNEQLIIAPIVGLVIGWITNSLAIKMLFRPRKAYYIGKFRIPLTPGVIPKEQPRLAKAVGDAVSHELLGAEVLQSALNSDSMQEKVGSIADNIFARYSSSKLTLKEDISAIFGSAGVDKFVNGAYDSLAEIIYKKLNDSSFNEELLTNIISKSLTENPPKGILKKLAGENTAAVIAKPLSKVIYKRFSQNSYSIMRDILAQEGNKLLEQKTAALVTKHQDKLPQLRNLLIENYSRTVSDDLPKILESINIAKIIEDRINDYDISEMERLIRNLANKELNAIVVFGGILGFFMGFINVFISALFS
ncbi:MAG: DUF445 family protein [Firmicutes bacterium]|nr:DUF445 family protein [Bacillota bacterium]